MIWNKELLDDYLNGKDRTVDTNEYLLMLEFINEIRPDIIIDSGTYKGASGYILKTGYNEAEVYSIDNTDNQNYYPKEETTKEEHGMYLPDNVEFLTHGYEVHVPEIIEKNPNKEIFIFWDAGKNSFKVMNQIEMSHKYRTRYIAFHDSGKIQRSVRRAIKRAEQLGLYKIIKEDIKSCPRKGISVLELIE